MLSTLAAFLQQRRRWVGLATIALMLLAVVMTGDLQNRLTNGLDDYDDPGAPSVAARQLVQHATGVDPQEGYLLLVRTDGGLTPGAPAPAQVDAAAALLHSRPEVKSVLDYRSTPGLVSDDGRTTVVVGQIGSLPQTAADKATKDIQAAIAADPVLRGDTLLGGATPGHSQLGSLTTDDLARTESIATPILLLLLLFVFRGLVAALLPMVGGLFSILVAMLGMRVLTGFTHMSAGGLNLVAALGLGLSIDFSLLIVTRYREELARSGPGTAPLRRTVETAGRTVLFSALTVTAALSALIVFPEPYLRSMGYAGILTVLSAALFALVVLPALLAMLGRRVNSLAPKRWQQSAGRVGSGRWHRLAATVMRRPVLFAAAGLVVMLGLASPALGIRFTGVSLDDTPTAVSSGQVAHALQHEFTVPPTGPVQAVVDTDSAGTAAGLAARTAKVPGVSSVGTPTRLDPAHWEFDVHLADPLGPGGAKAVTGVKALSGPTRLRLTGGAADVADQSRAIASHLPLAGALLAVITLLLLFVFTGSVVLPLKALLMNALSVGAAFGVLVWGFQQGHLGSLLDFQRVGALEQTSPILLFALAFGLATDYNLFLLGRVRELRAAGHDDQQAVAEALERTGPMVTSAAALFCVAVGAMAFSRVVLIKELGVGTAFAVLVDATVVRGLLVPSLMRLLGARNWWAPGPLRRLHTRLGLDRMEGPPEPVAPLPAQSARTAAPAPVEM